MPLFGELASTGATSLSAINSVQNLNNGHLTKNVLRNNKSDGQIDDLFQNPLQEDREVCKYGSRCYRKNEHHLQTKKHPHSKFFICYDIIYLNFSVEELLPDFMKNPNDFAISSNLKQKLDIEDEEKVLEQLAILEQAISPFIITVRKYLFLFYF